MTLPDNCLVTIADLEVRNGQADDASFLVLSPFSVLNLTRLSVSSMAVTVAGSTMYGVNGAGQATLSQVTFTNCSSPSAWPAAMKLISPNGWFVEDLTFNNCTFVTNSLTESTYTMQVIAFPTSFQSSMTFGGQITVKSEWVSGSFESVVFQTSGTFTSMDILSYVENPSNWLFSLYKQPALRISTQAGPINFEAGSITALDTSSDNTSPQLALITVGGYTPNLTIADSLTVFNYGAILTQATPSTLLKVGGTFTSTGSRFGQSIGFANPGNITAGELLISDHLKWAVSVSPNSHINVTSDFRIWKSSQSVSTSYTAINAPYGEASITVGRLFSVSSLTRQGNGAAVEVSSVATMKISAPTMDFTHNNATGSGGAVYLASGAKLSLLAEIINFKNNTATRGGALALAGSSSSLTASGSITFTLNRATTGAALFIFPEHIESFGESAFESNTGDTDCAVHVESLCTLFNTSGTVYGNLQSVNASSCSDNDYLCSIPTPVEVPEIVPASIASCPGAPPSLGAWICIGATWISNGTVSGEALRIPSGSQVVVIKGDLVVAGDVTFGGLGSSLTIEGGCAHIDGSLNVELSNEELEAISKERSSSRSVQLIAQNSSCDSLASLAVKTKKTQKSCHKVDSKSSTTSDAVQSSLVAVFRVNSSGCNVKWIILGCVLGGVLLLVMIVILVVTFNHKAKAAVRPFWARKRAKRTRVE
jgi:hypothetical protein